MRSLKIVKEISVDDLRVGGWYEIETRSCNKYIFKFNGMIDKSGRRYIGRDYSYCITYGTYGDVRCDSICEGRVVFSIKRISNDIDC